MSTSAAPFDPVAELRELQRQLKLWQTKVMMRHAEAPTGAFDCTRCRGTKLTHYCLMPHATPVDKRLHPDTDECLHPNQAELMELDSLRDRACDVLAKALVERWKEKHARDLLTPFGPPPEFSKPSVEDDILARMRRWGPPPLIDLLRTARIVAIADLLADPPKKPKDEP